MKPYLAWDIDLNDPGTAAALDELPFWSAPFGLMLLEKIRIRRDFRILDIASGSGFPLLEIAQRAGETCRVFGIDPWARGVERTRQKIGAYRLRNVVVIKGIAERLPFRPDSFDLLVSNNGLNNVGDPVSVLVECQRVAKTGAQFVVTYNLPATMEEFYAVFEETLGELGKKSEIEKMRAHIQEKRKPVEWTRKILSDNGFHVSEIETAAFRIRFLDGSAMLRSFFIVSSFLGPWKRLIGEDDIDAVFGRLEEKLNRRAGETGDLRLTIPMVCLDCRKV